MSDNLNGFNNQLTPEGKELKLFRLGSGNGFEITFMDWGATWLSCKVPLHNGDRRETLLRSATFADHLAHSVYFGATVGRYANRIKGGTFKVNGESALLSRNHFDNTLHGGTRGFDRHSWTGVQENPRTVVFTRCSKNGEEGFPGKLDVRVTYQISEQADGNALTATFEAVTNKRTPINLTNHAYFNLSGDETILDHHLSIDADFWLPVDEQCIPVDELQSVEETSHDFRLAKTFRRPSGTAVVYDHSYLVRGNKTPAMNAVARLTSPLEDLSLEIVTNKPAIQLYNGQHLQGLPGGDGKILEQYAGIALETQFLPDSPNHPEWPHESSFFDPDQVYRYQTIYSFRQ
jgi:aldose 1-epimerase